jgi:hypothetical protein
LLLGKYSTRESRQEYARAIASADPLVRKLFAAEFIDLKLAALLGPRK